MLTSKQNVFTKLKPFFCSLIGTLILFKICTQYFGDIIQLKAENESESVAVFKLKATAIKSREDHLTREVKNSSTKLILFLPQHKASWSNEAFSDIVKGHCETSCETTTDKSRLPDADAVVVLLLAALPVHINLNKRNKDQNNQKRAFQRIPGFEKQIWVLLQYESTERLVKNFGTEQPYNAWLGDQFNWTMSPRGDSEIRVMSGRTLKRLRPLSEKGLLQEYPSWDQKRSFKDYKYVNETVISKLNLNEAKIITPVVWFGSHCHAENNREAYIRELQKHIGVHIYGACGPLSCETPRYLMQDRDITKESCFDLVNQNYAFIIAFENSLCKDYNTEKTYNALLHNAIPLVLSGESDSDLYPPHSVISVSQFGLGNVSDPLSGVKELSNYLEYLLQNQTAYMSYFSWRRDYSVISYFSRPPTCDLCNALHSHDMMGNKKKRIKKYSDVKKWIIENAKCQEVRNLTGPTSLFQILKTCPKLQPKEKDETLEDWRRMK